MKIDELRMIDVRDPKIVEILLSEDRTVLWVNVDNICVLRVTQPSGITLNTNGLE